MIYYVCSGAKVIFADGPEDRDGNPERVPVCSKCAIRCKVHPRKLINAIYSQIPLDNHNTNVLQ